MWNRLVSIKSAILAFSLLVAETANGDEIVVSRFARNVVRHVLYHELAHALIREFDLPVLANEEAMADAFATIYLTERHRDQAPEIITDRIRSWIYEDSEVDPNNYDFKGEHLLDIRRAYQNGCLFYGLDPAEFERHIAFLNFSERDLSDCSDTAPDQQNGWGRVLAEHLLPSGVKSNNVEVIFGEGPMKEAMQASKIVERFAFDVVGFKWPKKITIHFDHCDFGASWSRSKRRILLCDDYVQRFVEQGRFLAITED